MTARSQPEAGPADHIFIHRQFEVVCAVAGCEHPPARSQPEAGLRHRLVQASIYLTSGDVRAAHAEIAAALATPAAGPTDRTKEAFAAGRLVGFEEGLASAPAAGLDVELPPADPTLITGTPENKAWHAAALAEEPTA